MNRMALPVPELRLRAPTGGAAGPAVGPPLSQWAVPDVPLRDIAVGPSRHLVKFVEADGGLWAVKEMPPRIAEKEYTCLRRLEDMGLPAVRPAGLVRQPEFDTAILLTRLPRRLLAVPAAVHAAAARISPSTGHGCSTRWPVCWSSFTGTACSGATVRWPTHCSPATARSCRRRWSTPRPARCTRRCPTAT